MRLTSLLFAVAFSSTVLAKGILPCMVYRYGLTNEQMDDLLDRHPNGTLQITAQDWRAMRYQLHRFDCMTNYVNLIGSTQDCARVLLDLHDRTETLVAATNAFAKVRRGLEAQRDTAAERANEYAEAYTAATNAYAALNAQYNQSVADFQGVLHNLVEEYNTATNSLAVAQARAERAEARHDAIVSWAEEQRDKALLSTTKAIWQTFIDRLKREED